MNKYTVISRHALAPNVQQFSGRAQGGAGRAWMTSRACPKDEYMLTRANTQHACSYVLTNKSQQVWNGKAPREPSLPQAASCITQLQERRDHAWGSTYALALMSTPPKNIHKQIHTLSPTRATCRGVQVAGGNR